MLILSGDHIYKMDYSDMLREHIEKDAACTISVLQVSMEEATRFGIMNVGPDGYINEFEEKPKQPKSDLASMGIYIFNWKKLREYLIADENDPNSDKDFGKNIIPALLENHERLYAYRFEGYWKDVGTIDSLWEANMDLLSPTVSLDLYDPAWKIYSNNDSRAPQLIGKKATVQNSMVTTGCVIDGSVEFSIISGGVTIEEGAVVMDSILMPGATVKKGAVVEYSIVGENSVIEAGAVIGARPETIANKEEWGIAVVGHDVTIGAGKVVSPKQIISADI